MNSNPTPQHGVAGHLPPSTLEKSLGASESRSTTSSIGSTMRGGHTRRVLSHGHARLTKPSRRPVRCRRSNMVCLTTYRPRAACSAAARALHPSSPPHRCPMYKRHGRNYIYSIVGTIRSGEYTSRCGHVTFDLMLKPAPPADQTKALTSAAPSSHALGAWGYDVGLSARQARNSFDGTWILAPSGQHRAARSSADVPLHARKRSASADLNIGEPIGASVAFDKSAVGAAGVAAMDPVEAAVGRALECSPRQPEALASCCHCRDEVAPCQAAVRAPRPHAV